jgi:hypothetical protein
MQLIFNFHASKRYISRNFKNWMFVIYSSIKLLRTNSYMALSSFYATGRRTLAIIARNVSYLRINHYDSTSHTFYRGFRKYWHINQGGLRIYRAISVAHFDFCPLHNGSIKPIWYHGNVASIV